MTVPRKPFDLLSLYGRFSRERKVSLTGPETVAAFFGEARAELDGALADPALVHGQRAAAMFEALVIALDRFRLLKAEDNGRIHPTGKYRAPDFRIILEDGEQWLVEVKNVYEQDPLHQHRQLMTSAYYTSLDAYARATGATLKLAVFWARWSIWTLVSPDRLLDGQGRLRLGMHDAMLANELSRLGDRMIGTRPPLRLRFTADRSKPNTIGDDGFAPFTIGEVTLLCENRMLSCPVEREIAWILIQFGEWAEQNAEAIVSDGRLHAIEFRWEPQECSNEGLGFEMVGALSRMFSRYYALQTLSGREVVQIEAKPRPGWFAPLTSADYQSQALPLWRIVQQPTHMRSEMGGDFSPAK